MKEGRKWGRKKVSVSGVYRGVGGWVLMYWIWVLRRCVSVVVGDLVCVAVYDRAER